MVISDLRRFTTPRASAAASASTSTSTSSSASGKSRAVRTLRGHSGAVTGVQWSGDGAHLASTSHDCTLNIWDLSAVSAAAKTELKASIFGSILIPVSAPPSTASPSPELLFRHAGHRSPITTFDWHQPLLHRWPLPVKPECSFTLATFSDELHVPEGQ